MTVPADIWPRLPNGLPYKERGETFGRYWNRITHEEAQLIAWLSKNLGILPSSVFSSYIPTATEQ